MNNVFFRHNRKQDADEVQLKELLEAKLYGPLQLHLLPKELKDEPEEPKKKDHHRGVANGYVLTPGFREVQEDPQFANQKANDEFWKTYQEDYIKEEETEDMILVETLPETPKKSSTAEFKNVKVSKFFDLEKWCDEEELLFKELVCIYGTNWNQIANIMQSKTPVQIESFFKANKYDITCHLCGTSTDDSQLLLCDGCDRAYHLYCLRPPLKAVPKKAWFCSTACESITKTVTTHHYNHPYFIQPCEVCEGMQDEEKMLLCDSCDKGYHMYCLKPPLNEVPTEQWCCVTCSKDKESNSSSTPPPPTTTSAAESVADAVAAVLATSALSNGNDSSSPSGEGHKDPFQSKKVHRCAKKLVDSLSASLTFSRLKMLAVRFCRLSRQLDITKIREDSLSTLSDTSIFNSMPNPDPSDIKMLQHFASILLGVDMAVDLVYQNPKGIVKPEPLLSGNAHRGIVKHRKASKKGAGRPHHVSRRARKKKYDNSNTNEGPRSWIFQANSRFYDIEASVRSLSKMTWFIKQHIYKIKIGDKVYIWISGKDGTCYRSLHRL